MDNILRDEVNQHTSDEVEKVLAELEAQGVDITALQTALAGQGVDITAIKDILAGMETGSSGMKVKSFQRGEAKFYVTGSGSGVYSMDVTISSVTPAKCLPIVGNGFVDGSSSVGVVEELFFAKVYSSTKLRIYSNNKRNAVNSVAVVPWFVIEFE